MKKLHLKWKTLSASLLVVGSLGFFGIAQAGTAPVALVTPDSPEDITTIDQRLAARKVAYKAQVADAEAGNLSTKCTLAQTALTDVRNKDNKAAAVRQESYTSLSTRLSYLVDNLSSQSVDATKLLDAENGFTAAINNYLVDAAAYKTAMDDAINVSCKADPAGFKASLLDARKYRALLASDVAAVKSSVKVVTQTLAEQRQGLIKNPGKAPATGVVGTKAR